MRKSIAVAVLGIGFFAVANVASAQSAGPRFEITFPASAHAGPITGRVFVMLSQNNDAEPRFQIGRTGGPFFGRDIEKLAPGSAATIDGTDLGSPIESLNDLPPGDYFVQAMINVYSEFKRADGHVLWMHDDQWEGQRWEVSPGNLKSNVQKVHIDPKAGNTQTIKLVTSDVIPPVEVPADTEWVKRFKIQSPALTKFWGRRSTSARRFYCHETTLAKRSAIPLYTNRGTSSLTLQWVSALTRRVKKNSRRQGRERAS